jgi:hypothetical protein
VVVEVLVIPVVALPLGSTVAKQNSIFGSAAENIDGVRLASWFNLQKS